MNEMEEDTAPVHTLQACGATPRSNNKTSICSKDEVKCQISSATGIVPSTAANCRSCGDYSNVLGLN